MKPDFSDMKVWLKDSPSGMVYEAKTGNIGHNRARTPYGEVMQNGDLIGSLPSIFFFLSFFFGVLVSISSYLDDLIATATAAQRWS